MTILTDLQAALPGKTITLDASGGYNFVPGCNVAEWLIAVAIIDPSWGKAIQAKTDIVSLGQWATWTQSDFDTWCTNNLMTDAAVDATTLSAALKTNIKANNAFTRNGGKMLIAVRNVVFWLLKLQGINGV